MKQDKKELLSLALDLLYKLEEATDYENSNVSEAINLLQNEIETFK